MSRMISPNEMFQAAKDQMIEGREPETTRDWELVMNFVAANTQRDVAHPACKLFKLIYKCPLTDVNITEIVDFQLTRAG